MDKLNARFDFIAYLRPTEKCNLRCKHCFIPPNSNCMDDAQILDIPNQLSKAGVAGRVLLQWHGGEPLLMDPYRCEEIIIKLNNNSHGIKFLHGVQTNLVVLNDYSNEKRQKWFEVLSKYFDKDFIGVSWDKDIRGINIKSDNFESCFITALKNIRQSDHFPNDFSPHVTITSAKPFLNHISTFEKGINFIKYFDQDLGLNRLHIEKLTPTGDATKNWNEIGVSNLDYSTVMARFYLAYIRYKQLNESTKLSISPYDDIEDALLDGTQDNICASGACQSSMFTFSNAGLLNRCTAIYEHNQQDIDTYLFNVGAACKDCEFNAICNGGCPAHKNVVDSSGECSGAYILLNKINNLIKLRALNHV